MDSNEKIIVRRFIAKLLMSKKVLVGHSIDFKWFLVPANANAKIIKDNWINEIEEMYKEGFFEKKEKHGDTLFLTNKGYKNLYSLI